MIRVYVADDHAMLREGLRATLGTVEDVTVVGESEDVSDLEPQLEALSPDVLILDLNMPGILSPVATVRHLAEAFPDVRILVYTGHSNPELARLLLIAGARGLVPKDEPNATLIAAMHRVAADDIYLPEHFVGREPPSEPLTLREAEVLDLLGQGLTPEQIAEMLHISLTTCRTHLRNIYPKLGVAGMSQAMLYAAVQRGLFLARRPHGAGVVDAVIPTTRSSKDT